MEDSIFDLRARLAESLGIVSEVLETDCDDEHVWIFTGPSLSETGDTGCLTRQISAFRRRV